ncbi:hypothetical protein [Methylobacterium nonmethylotrophicum]|uniref:Uncharacterized protein n=1 Tax=Methylobacterium nonmethylotrophicum TaxID=1141884 RepID=A0A4Z0NPB9_9HYPH|nr:hypothetical protein [Methylobacterium nonmethylotrophicum]TGD98058.1 hypothetical protein EU555_18090 [Methylobacterium nonmethylotrophicum]
MPIARRLPPVAARLAGPPPSSVWRRLVAAAAAAALMLPGPPASARILSQADRATIAQMKPRYAEVVGDVARTAERADLPAADGECVRDTLRALTQISDELGGYESLITIEGQLVETGDDAAVKDAIRFAVANALKILDIEQRRLDDLSTRCARLPLAAEKVRAALRFIESTAAILRAVQPQL